MSSKQWEKFVRNETYPIEMIFGKVFERNLKYFKCIIHVLEQEGYDNNNTAYGDNSFC